MTVPAAGTVASSSAIPQTQNTAPVREFRCLYTSDLRRKQKRWQDGRLKYHTFNKRIMVYDDRSNFVGDSHWREDHTFGEGEEVELERCGILVEVSECVGTREQDLTPLLNKVLRDRQERTHVRAVASSPLRRRGPIMRTEIVDPSHAELTERLAKRRKPNNSPSSKNGYAQNLTGAILAFSGAPSAAVPRRYNPGLLRTTKKPIEEIDVSSTTRLNQPSQERPVAIRISHTRSCGRQPESMSKDSSSADVESGYARNITGAALILASKTIVGRRLPPGSGTAKKTTSQSRKSSAQAVNIEEDGFIDIDVYDTENLQVENATTASSAAAELANSRQKKSSPDLIAHQPRSEVGQPERQFNPLRIKTRPKRKLLSTANSPSRPPLFSEPSIGNSNGPTCPLASPKTGCELQPPVTVSQATSVTETRLLNMEEHCSSFHVNGETDHRDIDVLLTRKHLGQTSVAKGLHSNLQPCNKITRTTQSAEETRNPVGSGDQGGTLSSLIPSPRHQSKQKNTRSPRQLSIIRGNTDSEIEKARIGAPKNFSTPPRLMKSFSEGADADELRGIAILTTAKDSKILRPTYQVGRDLPMKRGLIPFKPPAKLACAITQGTNVARRVNKQGEFDEHAMPPMIPGTGPAVPISKAKIACQEAVPGRDQGPWSREAFDLFDWRPGAATMGDSLAAG